MEPIKLQKYFTDCGVLSRRAAENEIRKGRVLVNGSPASIGMRIVPERDSVEYRGKPVLPSHTSTVCIMLNKPRGYITTLSDDRGRKTVADLITDVGRRVYPVGRLDADSDGLLLLTDDGALANQLTHPRHEIPKIYHVFVRGTVSDEQLAVLRAPMTLDGYTILPVQTERNRYCAKTDETVLEMRLYEGRNRQIRKMCEQVSLTITRLSRIAVGTLTMDKLPVGTWRYLTERELCYLRKNAQRSKNDERQSSC